MESISANKSCNKHDPPTAKIPEVINNEPNVFNSRHEANEGNKLITIKLYTWGVKPKFYIANK